MNVEKRFANHYMKLFQNPGIYTFVHVKGYSSAPSCFSGIMKKIILLSIFCLSVFAEDLIGFETNYNELKTAKFNGEKIFVVFSATWCGPCKKFKKQVLSTQRFRDLGAKLGLRLFNIDVDENSSNVGEWSITGIPAWFLVKDGQIAHENLGFQSANIEQMYEKIEETFADDAR